MKVEGLFGGVAGIVNRYPKAILAVTVSGLVTAASFPALMLSSFPIIAGFGLATVIVVLFSLPGAVVVMPAILTLVGGLGERRSAV